MVKGDHLELDVKSNIQVANSIYRLNFRKEMNILYTLNYLLLYATDTVRY
jgi:hypothetical protein